MSDPSPRPVRSCGADGAERVASLELSSAKIEAPKILDLILSKQTQFYTLWGVYTAVEFTAAGFLGGQRISMAIGLAVLVGVWLFNFGHLGFVLRCIEQLHKFNDALNVALDGGAEAYQTALDGALRNVSDGGGSIWYYFRRAPNRQIYVMNSVVHFSIDICASIALIARIDNPWLHAHTPDFLKAIL